MAVIKISELPETMSMADDDVFAIVKGTATQKISKTNFVKDINIETADMVYVAKNGSDSNAGTIVAPFLTIGAANDYAMDNLPAWPGRIVIQVAPGIYTEHITQAHYRVYIVGNTRTPDEKEKDVTIRNLGDCPANYPLSVAKNLNLIGINVVTTDIDNEPIEGIYGEIIKGSTFSYCNFINGYFIEQTEPVSTYMQFAFCHFQYGRAFDLSGTVGFHRAISLGHCTLEGNPVFGSSGSGTKSLKLSNSFITDEVKVEGDWSLQMQSSEMHTDGHIVFDTDGFIDIYNSIIVNGLHFTSDTSDVKKFVNNYFKDITPGQTDITVAGGVTITIVDYSGNKQENGLPAEFQIAGGDRNVGAFAENKYCSLQSAVSSIPAGESGIIELYENQSDLAELTLNTGSGVTIKCSKKYNLAFTGNVVTLGANQSLSIHEVAFLDGGKMEINGDSALLAFEGCLTVQGYIVSTAGVGSMVFSYFSSLVSVTGHPVIQIDNTDTLHVAGYSRLKGATGQPAIVFNVLTEDKLKGKFTTFLHGDFGGNAPFTYAGAGKVEFAIYNSAFNAALSAATFTNTIGSPNNSVSPEINF